MKILPSVQMIKVIPTPSPWIKLGKKRHTYYKGIRMLTDEGLHEQLMYIINRYRQQKDSVRVLDWGCGRGAFSQRLKDQGHIVTSVDKSANSFQADTEFVATNFDSLDEIDRLVEANRNRFDIVIASEVIEHVRNPWEFMAGIREVLKDDGLAIVSTPNISNVLSRIMFLFTGELQFFRETDLEHGHITPVSVLKMRIIASDTGWKFVTAAPGGTLPVFWLSWSPKQWLYTLLTPILRVFLRGYTSGWVNIYVLEKANTKPDDRET